MARRAPDAPLTPRTDRRDRVDVAVYRPDALLVWSPQWAAVEKVWLPSGGTLADEARQDIEGAVNAYIRRETIARAVPFQQDIAERISRLRTAAANFASALAIFGQGEGSREARSRLTAFLVTAEEDEPHLERLPRDVHDIIHASDMALADLNEDADKPDTPTDADILDVHPFKKWDAWECMIRKVYDLSRKHKLPIDIDNHRIYDGDPVPFIDAIIAIQATLPAEFQRYSSRDSLANAVLRITKDSRKGAK